jgi:hypothetical protein
LWIGTNISKQNIFIWRNSMCCQAANGTEGMY